MQIFSLKLDSYHLKLKPNICQVYYSKGSPMDHIEEYRSVPVGICNNECNLNRCIEVYVKF